MPIQGNIQKAKINDATPVTWSNGANFTGILRVGIVVPSFGVDTDSEGVTVLNVTPTLNLPLNTIFPVTNGKIDQSTELLYNASISPPNSQYVCWFYDSVGRLIAGPSTQFSVTSTPVTLPVLTLTAPVVGSTIPPSE